MFIDTFIEIFENTCVVIIPILPAVFAVWFIVDLISSLLFKD